MTREALADPVAGLRSDFDRTFAEPRPGEEAHEDLLGIRAGGAEFAFRTLEIAAILRCPPLAVLPSRSAALCGLAGVRGNVVAVFELASLTGGHAAPGGGWIVQCAGDPSVALRFDVLDGYERVRVGEIESAGTPTAEAPARESVRLRGAYRTVLSVPALLARLDLSVGSGTGRIDEPDTTDQEGTT